MTQKLAIANHQKIEMMSENNFKKGFDEFLNQEEDLRSERIQLRGNCKKKVWNSNVEPKVEEEYRRESLLSFDVNSVKDFSLKGKWYHTINKI